jgi:hypothetical protein
MRAGWGIRDIHVLMHLPEPGDYCCPRLAIETSRNAARKRSTRSACYSWLTSSRCARRDRIIPTEVFGVQPSRTLKPRPGLLVQAARFRPPSNLPLENLSVVPAKVLAARVELLVNRQPQLLAKGP